MSDKEQNNTDNNPEEVMEKEQSIQGLQIVSRPTEQANPVAKESTEKVEKEKQEENQPLGQDEVANKDHCEFNPGDSLKFIRVRFPGNAKSQPFLMGEGAFIYGQKVVALSDRGMTVGYINSMPYEVKFNRGLLPIKRIHKLATDEDIERQKSFLAQENSAEVLCLSLIDKYELNMNLTHVEFVQSGKKAVFYFNAPERVDFRELVKSLVSELKMRIELRQISVRDRAAAIGGIGACGLQTCCSSFLKSYGNVSIKMAKNQNLALVPSKINGVCGQLKCCIKYEDEVYSDKRKKLPKEGHLIRTENGDIGKVLRLQIIPEQFDLLTTKGVKKRYVATQWLQNERVRDNEFPESFQHITDETHNVVGLEERLNQQEDDFFTGQDDFDDTEEDIAPMEDVDESAMKYREKNDKASYDNEKTNQKSRPQHAKSNSRHQNRNKDKDKSKDKNKGNFRKNRGPKNRGQTRK